MLAWSPRPRGQSSAAPQRQRPAAERHAGKRCLGQETGAALQIGQCQPLQGGNQKAELDAPRPRVRQRPRLEATQQAEEAALSETELEEAAEAELQAPQPQVRPRPRPELPAPQPRLEEAELDKPECAELPAVRLQVRPRLRLERPAPQPREADLQEAPEAAEAELKEAAEDAELHAPRPRVQLWEPPLEARQPREGGPDTPHAPKREPCCGQQRRERPPAHPRAQTTGCHNPCGADEARIAPRHHG